MSGMIKYFWQVPANKTAASLDRLAGSIKSFSESQENISREEIKSKDRVDIPLSEYLEMLNTIRKQEQKLRELYRAIKRLGFPYEVIDSIVPDSIQVYKNADLRDFITHYQIRFDADESLGILRRSYK